MFTYEDKSQTIIQTFIDWFKTLFYGFTQAGNWITQPLVNLNGVDISPMYILTFSGITIFVAVAIVKWVAS